MTREEFTKKYNGFIQRNHKLGAVKFIKDITGLDLKDSKEIADITFYDNAGGKVVLELLWHLAKIADHIGLKVDEDERGEAPY